MKSLQYDERMSQVTGRVSQIVLSLTHIALGAIVLYRAGVLDQATKEFADIQIVFALSMLGNLFGLLFFGGYLPVINFRNSLRLYLVSVFLLFVTLSAIYGFPKPEEWAETILPVVVGPALIVGVYYAVAQMGRRRIEKMLDKEDLG